MAVFAQLRALLAAENEGEPLSVAELKTVGATLKELTKAFADLHLIPHGAMRTAPLRFGDSVPPQHLHLHSHGGKKSNPQGIDALPAAPGEEVIEVESRRVESEGDLEDEQAALLAAL